MDRRLSDYTRRRPSESESRKIPRPVFNEVKRFGPDVSLNCCRYRYGRRDSERQDPVPSMFWRISEAVDPPESVESLRAGTF